MQQAERDLGNSHMQTSSGHKSFLVIISILQDYIKITPRAQLPALKSPLTGLQSREIEPRKLNQRHPESLTNRLSILAQVAFTRCHKSFELGEEALRTEPHTGPTLPHFLSVSIRNNFH